MRLVLVMSVVPLTLVAACNIVNESQPWWAILGASTCRRRTVVARKIVVVGGGAAGMGAAGGIKAVDPGAR